MFSFVLLICFFSFVWCYDTVSRTNDDASNVQADPASSWLAYTKAAGLGKRVTFVNASWIVPSYPSNPFGSNAPGFWFGIEPNPATDLIQPILAWGDELIPKYTIFSGYYQWDNSEWLQSASSVVYPGYHIYAYIKFLPHSNEYETFIACEETKWSLTTKYAIESGKLYTDVYFVLEHQPDFCDAYPADGVVKFTDIHIEWENKFSTNPHWTAHTFKPACQSTAHVDSPTAVSFKWKP